MYITEPRAKATGLLIFPLMPPLMSFSNNVILSNLHQITHNDRVFRANMRQNKKGSIYGAFKIFGLKNSLFKKEISPLKVGAFLRVNKILRPAF